VRCVLSVHIDNYRRNATLWRHESFASDHFGSCRPARPVCPSLSQHIRAWHPGGGSSQASASHRLPAVGTEGARPHHAVAIPNKARAPKMDYPPLRIVRFSGAALTDGIEEHLIDGVTVRVTNVARTVADCSTEPARPSRISTWF